MPLPLIPLAGASLAALAVVRLLRVSLRPVRIDQRGEDALDDLDEGVEIGRSRVREQANASGRYRRTVRFRNGDAVEIDAGWLARVRVRRLRRGT